MASLGNPRSWVPYMNSKDCSQGFCSLYCPQWCYVVYPPPPPPVEFPDEDSSPNFSPIVIAIIGVLASAFLLVSYYTLISKYCGGGHRESSPSEIHQDSLAFNDDNHDPSFHEPWHHAANAGLDEALIKSITCFKYRRGEGLAGSADCSVCLGEFQDGEALRLLPKCSHAFHLPCIDTWLKSHSNCPLCRAAIFAFGGGAASTAAAASTPPSVLLEELAPSRRNEASSENSNRNDSDENAAANGGREVELDGVVEQAPKAGALRAFSDLGNFRGRHSVIEIRDEECDESIRRSVSMDHSFQIGDVVLHMNQDQGGSKRSRGESSGSSTSNNKFSYRRRVLHCVLSPIAMKRSFSSGRFSFSRNGGRGFSLFEN